MNLNQYLRTMSVGAALCWVAWGAVLIGFDPRASGQLALWCFYITLFLALLGTFSVAGFLVRRIVLKSDEAVFRHVSATFGQSVFGAGLIILSLFLLAHRMLTWWNALLLLLLLITIPGASAKQEQHELK